MSAFPKLRRLEVEGFPCKLSSQGLQLHKVLSLNPVDVVNVSAEQLLEVLRNSPYLESLELGRSPITCPVQPASAQIHLPYLTTLHLVFMPIPVSNFFLSTINAPNCSELSISSDFSELPDRDVVKSCLFTSSTNHFTPVLQTLLARGQHKNIDVESTNSNAGKMGFILQFHDEDRDYTDVDTDSIIRLEFRLNSVQQMEENIRWLTDCLQRDAPKISIRLYMYGFEEVRLMNLLDSYTTITHLGFGGPSNSEDTMPNPILAYMAQPTQSGWPLPNLGVFVYRGAEAAKSQDEAILAMLRRRYLSSSEGPDNERIRPRPIKKRIEKKESGAVQAAALFGLYTFYGTQPDPSTGYTYLNKIPIAIDTYVYVLTLPEVVPQPLSNHVLYVLKTFIEDETFTILPDSSLHPYQTRDLPNATLVPYEYTARDGRPTKPQLVARTRHAVNKLDNWVQAMDAAKVPDTLDAFSGMEEEREGQVGSSTSASNTPQAGPSTGLPSSSTEQSLEYPVTKAKGRKKGGTSTSAQLDFTPPDMSSYVDLKSKLKDLVPPDILHAAEADTRRTMEGMATYARDNDIAPESGWDGAKRVQEQDGLLDFVKGPPQATASGGIDTRRTEDTMEIDEH
ncbi:hypothetical protein FRC04_010915 [Tulasnella sp. 424]|nr:hypothetical protein FRC04_010915 [Tulasnella sp. 424]